MKILLHKIATLLMTFVLLFSTMSFTVHKHFCKGELAAMRFYFHADTCQTSNVSNEFTKNCDADKVDQKSCCQDETASIDGNQQLTNHHDGDCKCSLQQLQFITSFVYTNLQLYDLLERNIVPYQHYSPPLLIQDIPVLDQSFLI